MSQRFLPPAQVCRGEVDIARGINRTNSLPAFDAKHRNPPCNPGIDRSYESSHLLFPAGSSASPDSGRPDRQICVHSGVHVSGDDLVSVALDRLTYFERLIFTAALTSWHPASCMSKRLMRIHLFGLRIDGIQAKNDFLQLEAMEHRSPPYGAVERE